MQGHVRFAQACQTALTGAHVHARAETVGRDYRGAGQGLRRQARAQRHRAALPGAQRPGRRDRAWRALLASVASQDACLQAGARCHKLADTISEFVTPCTSLQACVLLKTKANRARQARSVGPRCCAPGLGGG
jgi:hypothetical protein